MLLAQVKNPKVKIFRGKRRIFNSGTTKILINIKAMEEVKSPCQLPEIDKPGSN